ncbi:MAG: xerC [Candidatus Paceibacter sp.]|jgi:integrase/recombinase XerC|nr:xerC [Candidatus Paceibacter sp.]
MSDELSLVEQFLMYLSAERFFSNYTINAYRNDLFVFMTFLDENGKLTNEFICAVDIAMIHKFIANQRAANYNASTVARRIAALRSFYKWLKRTGRVAVDPLRLVASVKKPQTVVQIATAEQIMHLLAMPDTNDVLGARDQSMIEIMCSTGAKVSELVALGMDAVDTSETVPQLCIGGKKKRTIPLSMAAYASLQRYLDLRAKELDTSSPFIFVNKFGQSLSTRSVRRKLAKYLEEAGIDPNISPFTLRHTYAQHLIGQGESEESVRQALGHNSKETVRHVYRGLLEQPPKQQPQD